ncbi:hypothetical protein TNIN_468581 [Trichonephila inaurata madagascariensis]|uniref:small monomeric GTPase n=1 Tax=Trichonephila inaurata madagascariensis TaxID=2747483 RepID=A0A8X6X500_9ARAC|nr:hypothetical protein TNIN_468581 [Trichonephila inaurata madagascariensis]
MTNLNGSRLKVLVLGARGVGKSAVTVRYLTRRYIGEYSSSSEFLYKQSINFDNVTTEVEILDTSQCEDHCCLQDHIKWADAYVVVYSVCDRSTFEVARKLLETVNLSKGARRVPAILLAENYVGVSLAFQSLMREARAAQQLRTLPVRRKTGPALSKMIGMVFGRGDKGASDRKKRPSLSI